MKEFSSVQLPWKQAGASSSPLLCELLHKTMERKDFHSRRKGGWGEEEELYHPFHFPSIRAHSSSLQENFIYSRTEEAHTSVMSSFVPCAVV